MRVEFYMIHNKCPEFYSQENKKHLFSIPFSTPTISVDCSVTYSNVLNCYSKRQATLYRGPYATIHLTTSVQNHVPGPSQARPEGEGGGLSRLFPWTPMLKGQQKKFTFICTNVVLQYLTTNFAFTRLTTFRTVM